MPKLFEVTWTAMGNKCVHVETVQAVTKMQAQSIIRWRELANQTEIKDMTVKELA